MKGWIVTRACQWEWFSSGDYPAWIMHSSTNYPTTRGCPISVANANFTTLEPHLIFNYNLRYLCLPKFWLRLHYPLVGTP